MDRGHEGEGRRVERERGRTEREMRRESERRVNADAGTQNDGGAGVYQGEGAEPTKPREDWRGYGNGSPAAGRVSYAGPSGHDNGTALSPVGGFRHADRWSRPWHDIFKRRWSGEMQELAGRAQGDGQEAGVDLDPYALRCEDGLWTGGVGWGDQEDRGRNGQAEDTSAGIDRERSRSPPGFSRRGQNKGQQQDPLSGLGSVSGGYLGGEDAKLEDSRPLGDRSLDNAAAGLESMISMLEMVLATEKTLGRDCTATEVKLQGLRAELAVLQDAQPSATPQKAASFRPFVTLPPGQSTDPAPSAPKAPPLPRRSFADLVHEMAEGAGWSRRVPKVEPNRRGPNVLIEADAEGFIHDVGSYFPYLEREEVEKDLSRHLKSSVKAYQETGASVTEADRASKSEPLVGLFGAKGSGKTTAVEQLAEGLARLAADEPDPAHKRLLLKSFHKEQPNVLTHSFMHPADHPTPNMVGALGSPDKLLAALVLKMYLTNAYTAMPSLSEVVAMLLSAPELLKRLSYGEVLSLVGKQDEAVIIIHDEVHSLPGEPLRPLWRELNSVGVRKRGVLRAQGRPCAMIVFCSTVFEPDVPPVRIERPRAANKEESSVLSPGGTRSTSSVLYDDVYSHSPTTSGATLAVTVSTRLLSVDGGKKLLKNTLDRMGVLKPDEPLPLPVVNFAQLSCNGRDLELMLAAMGNAVELVNGGVRLSRLGKVHLPSIAAFVKGPVTELMATTFETEWERMMIEKTGTFDVDACIGNLENSMKQRLLRRMMAKVLANDPVEFNKKVYSGCDMSWGRLSMFGMCNLNIREESASGKALFDIELPLKHLEIAAKLLPGCSLSLLSCFRRTAYEETAADKELLDMETIVSRLAAYRELGRTWVYLWELLGTPRRDNMLGQKVKVPTGGYDKATRLGHRLSSAQFELWREGRLKGVDAWCVRTIDKGSCPDWLIALELWEDEHALEEEESGDDARRALAAKRKKAALLEAVRIVIEGQSKQVMHHRREEMPGPKILDQFVQPMGRAKAEIEKSLARGFQSISLFVTDHTASTATYDPVYPDVVVIDASQHKQYYGYGDVRRRVIASVFDSTYWSHNKDAVAANPEKFKNRGLGLYRGSREGDRKDEACASGWVGGARTRGQVGHSAGEPGKEDAKEDAKGTYQGRSPEASMVGGQGSPQGGARDGRVAGSRKRKTSTDAEAIGGASPNR